MAAFGLLSPVITSRKCCARRRWSVQSSCGVAFPRAVLSDMLTPTYALADLHGLQQNRVTSVRLLRKVREMIRIHGQRTSRYCRPRDLHPEPLRDGVDCSI